MAKPISIEFATDTKDVLRGADSIADSFDEVSDSLKDLAKDGERSADNLSDSFKGTADDADRMGEDLGDSVKDGLKEAETAAEKFAREVDQAFDKVSADARAAGDKIGKNTRDGFKKAEGGAKEFGDEANSTAKESAASFDGSAESIAESFQEVAANAFAGFGPAGAAAGLAAAIGIGIAISKMQEMAEVNNEAKEKMAELGAEIYETGGKLDDAAIAEKIKEIAFALSEEDNPWTFWADESKTGIGTVKEALEGLKDIDPADVFRGLAGEAEAGDEAVRDLTRSIERDQEALEGMTQGTAKYGEVLTEEGEALRKSINNREDLRDKIKDATAAQSDATAEVDYFTEHMGDSTEAIEARIEAEEKLKDNNLSALESNIKLAESTDELSATFKENGNTIAMNTEKGRANQSAILDHVETLNGWAQDQVNAGEDVASVTTKMQSQKNALLEQITPFFKSKEAARQYIDQVLKTPRKAKTDVELNGIPAAEQDLNHTARDRNSRINVGVGDTSGVSAYMASLSNQKVYFDYVPRNGKAVV